MSAAAAYDRLVGAGIRLSRKDDSLIASPRSAVTNEFRTLIRGHKAELLQIVDGLDYSAADIAEVDRLLNELARLERWTPEELAAKQAERARMALAMVHSALTQLRTACAAGSGSSNAARPPGRSAGAAG